MLPVQFPHPPDPPFPPPLTFDAFSAPGGAVARGNGATGGRLVRTVPILVTFAIHSPIVPVSPPAESRPEMEYSTKPSPTI